jgi:hypothetical protein
MSSAGGESAEVPVTELDAILARDLDGFAIEVTLGMAFEAVELCLFGLA